MPGGFESMTTLTVEPCRRCGGRHFTLSVIRVCDICNLSEMNRSRYSQITRTLEQSRAIKHQVLWWWHHYRKLEIGALP